MRVPLFRGATSRGGALLDVLVLGASALLLAFFLGSVIFGAYLNFSPVPFGDAWRGMVGFYLDSQQNPIAWWAQHNEHRIFFSKLLFWLNMRYFSGHGAALIAINVVLLLLTWWMLVAYAKKLVGFSSRREKAMVAATLGMLCFAWMQSQNIISNFQSMFILAFLLPLLSFYCLGRALEDPLHALRWRVFSLIFAVATAHCMINGLFVLPLLALQSWFSERSPRWFIIALACAALSLAVFWVDYQSPITGTLGMAEFKKKPLSVISFALAYLGGPCYIIFQKIEAAIIAGGLVVALTVYLLLSHSAYKAKPYAFALLAYIGYVFITAGITAVGRIMFPLTFAASSRYLTPTLIMWGALLILLLSRSRKIAVWPGIALVVTAAALVPYQLSVLKVDTSLYTPQAKAVAALAFRLEVNDPDAKRKMTFFYDANVENIIKRARANKVSIFSERYAYPANQIGRPLQQAGGERCTGWINFELILDQNRPIYRVGGMLAKGTPQAFRYVLFADAQGLVTGVAIPGRDVPSLAGPVGPLNFDGYYFGAPKSGEMRCIR